MLYTLFPVQTVQLPTLVRPGGHKRAVKSKDPLNGIAMYVQKTTHNINWQEARILARENN